MSFRKPSRNVMTSPGLAARSAAAMAQLACSRATDCGAPTWEICAYLRAAPTLYCDELRRHPSTRAYPVIGLKVMVLVSSPLLTVVLETVRIEVDMTVAYTDKAVLVLV